MNYARLFFITIFIVFTSIQSKAINHPKHIESTIENWLHKHFAHKLYEDLAYTEELFMSIKQHLLNKNHIQDMPHKDLKDIVKNKIKNIKQKKYRSEFWFFKHKKELTSLIKNYFKLHKNNMWGIYTYLNTCSQPICTNLQQTMKRNDILPAVINELIKSLINQLKPKGK